MVVWDVIHWIDWQNQMATIKEIKEQLAAISDLLDPHWTEFEADARSGVQEDFSQRKKKIKAY